MIPDFSGDYLKYDYVEDGDIIEIMNEGKQEYSEKLKKQMFNISVKRGDKVLIASPSNQNGQILQKAFGRDTANWVGKKFQVFKISGSLVYKPIVETKA